jgi:hypothetical protein
MTQENAHLPNALCPLFVRKVGEKVGVVGAQPGLQIFFLDARSSLDMLLDMLVAP